MINIVLLEPEIPYNTGNVGRTCSVTGAQLHLIRPLGFSVDDKMLRRAGMDYWKDLGVKYYDSFQDFLCKNPDAKLYLATTKARNVYSSVRYESDCYIMFGKESAGIPEDILLNYPDSCIRIPMRSESRSLNLSNSVSIILYETLRQQNFEGLLSHGELHKNKWIDN